MFLNNNIENSFRLIADIGKEIGTKGQTNWMRKKQGFTWGKILFVGQNMATEKVTTVIIGQTKKLVRPRLIKIDLTSKSLGNNRNKSLGPKTRILENTYLLQIAISDSLKTV